MPVLFLFQLIEKGNRSIYFLTQTSHITNTVHMRPVKGFWSATPHICRHTYCSNMARAGMNPKTLQYLMGHSDISVTMNTYTHLGLEDAEAELRRVAESQAAREELEKLSGKEHSVIKFSREA